MSKLLDELAALLDTYQREWYDSEYENAEEPDDDTGEYDGSIEHAFAQMYSGYIGDDYKEMPKPFTYDLPGVGEVEVIDEHDDYDDGHALYVVFKWRDHLFEYQGWDNSWDGDGGWEGPLREVVAKQVMTTVYERVGGPRY